MQFLLVKNSFAFLMIFSLVTAEAQVLKPGFNKQEYIDLMKVCAQFGDSTNSDTVPPPKDYSLVYTSPVVGMLNKWALWVDKSGVAAITIRGTVSQRLSWLNNFYAAMAPATGTLKLDSSAAFRYKLADDPRAAVHVGWLLSTGFLVRTMLPKIDSLYKTGTREFRIIGHSQGGAIAYLLTAYLRHLQKDSLLPRNIRWKTYCSAAPKPGNLYFAYDYEEATQGGWAFNVVNSADWVPETPASIQTVDDFNTINPFSGVSGMIRKQSWPKRWAMRYSYSRINNPSRKAARNYRKYLGNFVYRSLKKTLKAYRPPEYFHSNAYTRAGAFIVLKPDEEYFKKYPQDGKDVFVNHMRQSYLYLAEHLDMK